MNCTECKGSGFVALATDTNAMCYACNGTGLGTTVHCIICEKEEPRRHPGHFMCGNPECRAEIVKIVEAHKLKERIAAMEAGTLSAEVVAAMGKSMSEKVAKVYAENAISWEEAVMRMHLSKSSGRMPGDYVFLVDTRTVDTAEGTTFEKYVARVKLVLHTCNGIDGSPGWNCWRDDGNAQFFDVSESEMYDTREAAEAAMHAATALT